MHIGVEGREGGIKGREERCTRAIQRAHRPRGQELHVRGAEGVRCGGQAGGHRG